jgi:hypothetical protein
VIDGLVHGEQQGDDVAPFGVVCDGGGHLEVDVVGDVDVKERVGRGAERCRDRERARSR